MTKKHFIAFANYIKWAPVSVETRAAMAEMVCAMAQADNPRFDRARFMSACGL